MIRINNISKTYDDGGQDVLAVKDVSLQLDKGKFVAIIGPSGSGKSTLLTMMGALQKPSKGLLEIDEKDVYKLSENEISDIRFEKIGFVLQGSNLVPYLTVDEQFQMKSSVAKVKGDSIKEELMSSLNISHLKKKYPDEISGGERQRVAIGLALLLKPSILLADEPTASLDTQRAYNVVKLLKNATQEFDTTVVMVTHDTRMLEMCDEVYEMVDGILTQVNN